MSNYDACREKWMTYDQFECAKMLADLYGGFHHLDTIKPFGKGIMMNTMGDLATYDFNALTTAVFMAHDRAIRFSVASTGRQLRIMLYKRVSCANPEAYAHLETYKRHPTLDQAINLYREYYKGQTV